MNPKLPLNGHMHLHTDCRYDSKHYCVSDQSRKAFVQSHSQSQARLMFVNCSRNGPLEL